MPTLYLSLLHLYLHVQHVYNFDFIFYGNLEFNQFFTISLQLGVLGVLGALAFEGGTLNVTKYCYNHCRSAGAPFMQYAHDLSA